MQKSVVLKNGNQAVAEVQQPLVARSSGARYVFLGTFKTHYFFEEMMKKATEAGYSPIAGKVKMNGEWLKSVKIGPMSKKNAQLTMNKLKMDGFPQDIFVQK
jgi:cell division septation protein DedD